MKIIFVTLCLTLSSCSLVQYMPSSNCEYVNYERIGNKVKLNAECTV